MRQFVGERFDLALGRSSCLNYLHRLGFVLKQPKKRLLKADPVRRAEFVREYAFLRAVAAATKRDLSTAARDARSSQRTINCCPVSASSSIRVDSAK